MKCKNCGAELKPGSRFCRKCGAPVEIEAGASVNVSPSPWPQQPTNPGKSKKLSGSGEIRVDEQINPYPDTESDLEKETGRKIKGSKWILIALAVFLLAGGIGGGSLIVKASRTSKYQETISLANRYYNQLDYERAEELYLHSIEILPKQKDPYIQLVQIYIVTEKPQMAEAIVAKALDNLTAIDAEEVKQKADAAAKEMEEKKAEEAVRLAEAERLALQLPAYKAYAGILRQMLDGYYPAEFAEGWVAENGKLQVDSDISKPILLYSLKDLDDDGIDELLVKYDGSAFRGSYLGDSQSPLSIMGMIFTYNSELNQTAMLLDRAYSFIPLAKGFLKEVFDGRQFTATRNFNPLIFSKLNTSTKTYDRLLFIEEYDRKFIEEVGAIDRRNLSNYGEVKLVFPSEFDYDNDGILYRIQYLDSKEELLLDKQEMQDLVAEFTNNAEEIDLIYEDVTPDVIARLAG